MSDSDPYEKFKNSTGITHGLGLNSTARIIFNHGLNVWKKITGGNKNKRPETLKKEKAVIKIYKKLEKRNKKEFEQNYLGSYDVTKCKKVTGQDVFDAGGAEFGIKVRRIQQIINEYKETKLTKLR